MHDGCEKERLMTNVDVFPCRAPTQVYMVFSCTVLDLDTLYVAYNVPTIGIWCVPLVWWPLVQQPCAGACM